MGLMISAVPKNYDYENDWKFDFEKVSISYSGFYYFRDSLVGFCSNGKFNIESLVDYVGGIYYDDINYEVCIVIGDFEKHERADKNVLEYVRALYQLKVENKKLYSIFPFIMHNDCEGEMGYRQIEMCLPTIKEFNRKNPENEYYNYVNSLIKVMEKAIEIKGKLLFC